MQDFLYYVCWIYTCASRYDAFTRSVHSPAALILDKAVPGKGGMNWSICFRKRVFSGMPGAPGCAARGSSGEGQGMAPGVPQLSQRGQEGPRAELLCHRFCRGQAAGPCHETGAGTALWDRL